MLFCGRADSCVVCSLFSFIYFVPFPPLLSLWPLLLPMLSFQGKVRRWKWLMFTFSSPTSILRRCLYVSSMHRSILWSFGQWLRSLRFNNSVDTIVIVNEHLKRNGFSSVEEWSKAVELRICKMKEGLKVLVILVFGCFFVSPFLMAAATALFAMGFLVAVMFIMACNRFFP